MSAEPRRLTKSRFKLALECPTKLWYTGKSQYVNRSLDDSFLAALAEGGYQVGALACMMYPDGIAVPDGSQAMQLARTRELMSLDSVTIFEAAFEANGLFARVDILCKQGSHLDLIEVKAKSWHPHEDADFRDAKGRLKSDFLPYLQDVAFQRHVLGLALPQAVVRCYLMLADKSRAASVHGLNARFPVRRAGARIDVQPVPGTGMNEIGDPVLCLVSVDEPVHDILAGHIVLQDESVPFVEAVARLANAYALDEALEPHPSQACARCEFKASVPYRPGAPKSGFHECWSKAFDWQPADFESGTVLDIWRFGRKEKCIAERRLKPAQLTASDIGFDGRPPSADGMTHRHRQWYQCHGGWPGGGDWYLDRIGMARAMAGWRYPLHFIDFETCAHAIPFFRGQHPYDTVAFQFSHHVMQADGRIEHRSQFLETRPGVDPSLAFLRALQAALNQDDGTILRWAAHENSVLNQLRSRLELALQVPGDADAPADARTLIHFIGSITTRRVGRDEESGPRAMVDLCRLAERHYFHPATKGSSSLKKVLPALMSSAPVLGELYAQPRYGTVEMPSLNHEEAVAWWVQRDGAVCDPYDLLPPIFDDVTRTEQDALDAGLAPELQEGGAAMAAYARLQDSGLDEAVRCRIEAALLRYCELDTLAMVMAVQAWKADLQR